MIQLSFRASPVSIDADTTEISACQKCRRTDGRTDGFSALYSRYACVKGQLFLTFEAQINK